MGKENVNTDTERHRSDVIIIAKRLAYLYHYMVKNIIDEVGEKRAEEMVKKIIYEYGLNCGKTTKLKVEALGMEPIIENYHLGKDLPSEGWIKKKLDFEDENSSGVETSYCPFADIWKELNFEKWGRMYCFVDQAKYEGYNSGLQCFHDKNVLDGDNYCIVRVKNLINDR